jgi:hypothetical protein
VGGRRMSIKLRSWVFVGLFVLFILMFLFRNIWFFLFAIACYLIVIVYGHIEWWIWRAEIKNVGKNQFTIKQRNGKEYIFPYSQIEFCNIAFLRWYLSRGVQLEIILKQNLNRKTKYFFDLWPSSDVLFNYINNLSTQCDIYEVGWFFQTRKKYKLVATSSNWIPFEDRDKDGKTIN